MDRTDRGFAIYDQFEDRYGNEVTVQESSLASEACVWIFCHPGEVWTANAKLAGTVDDPSPHLTVAQAIRVRDALSQFISDQGETDGS